MGVNFTPYDINKFLSQYVQDPSVQRQLSQQGAVVNPLFNDQLKTISLDFIRMLHEKSKQLTSCHHALIPDPDVIGWNEEIGLLGSNNRITVRTSSAGTVVNILIDGEMFERESMYGTSYEPHEGKPDHVYDIVGLFTTGFSTVNPLKHPWGTWRDSPYFPDVGGNHEERIMPHRVGPQWGFEARPFVEDIKTAFENKWSQWGATVTTLPKNWH